MSRSIPLQRLVNEGVIVDESEVGNGHLHPRPHRIWVEVRPRNILIVHTGSWKFYSGMPKEDLVRCFCKHPRPRKELPPVVLGMELRWIGVDYGSADHSMNTSIRYRKPSLAPE